MQLKPYEKQIPGLYKSITSYTLRRLDFGAGKSIVDFEIIDRDGQSIGIVEATSIVDVGMKQLEALIKKFSGSANPFKFKIPGSQLSFYIPLNKRVRFNAFSVQFESVFSAFTPSDFIEVGLHTVYPPEHWEIFTRGLPKKLNDFLYSHRVESLGIYYDDAEPGVSSFGIIDGFTVVPWSEVTRLAERELGKPDNLRKLNSRIDLPRRELFIVADRMDLDMGITRESPGSTIVNLPVGVTRVWLTLQKTLGAESQPVWYSDGGPWVLSSVDHQGTGN